MYKFMPVFFQTEASKIDVIVERVINSHYNDCPLRLGMAEECKDGLCRYFTWHLNHYTAHRAGQRRVM